MLSAGLNRSSAAGRQCANKACSQKACTVPRTCRPMLCQAQPNNSLGSIVPGPISVNQASIPAADPVTAASDKAAKPVDRSKGLWTRCDKCGTILYIKHLKEHNYICFGCNYHLKMSSMERVEHLIDPGTWRPMDETLSPVDPLEFVDLKPYVDRIKEAQEKTGLQDAVRTGTGLLHGIPVALGVMDFGYMGGSMGSVVGEKLTRLIEYATQEGMPVIIVCTSGGARMQEGIFSLMQMAKISAALHVHQNCANLLYVAILTSPTTGQLYARSSRRQQKFKDVFEVQETSKKGSSSFSVPKNSNLKPSRTEMEFIQKKFMDARRLVTDEKLQGSKEIHDALEVLDSNKKLLVKYLQQPDSLFMKHLLDINDVLPHSSCIHMAPSKSSDDENHGCHKSGRKLARRNPRKKHRKSRKHCSSHVSPSDSNYVAKCPVKSSRIKLEDEESLSIFPKRIVVLKPNLGKAQNSSGTPSSHSFQSGCRKPSEFERIEIRGMETLRTKNHDDGLGVSSHEVRPSKEVSKKTKQVRENFEYSSMSSSLGTARHDRNGCPFIGNDSEAGKCNSSNMFGLNGQLLSSSFRYKKSSLSAEAKKRLSERWKTTCDYHNTGVVSRSCTLAEMLAMPEKETAPSHMEPRHWGESSGKNFNDQRIEPFGISSRDGWKDISLEKLSRSRSLPASSTSFEILKTNSESLRMDPLAIPKEPFKWERKEAISENLCLREHIGRRNSRHRRRKSHGSICSLEEFNDPVLEICTSQNQDSDFKDNEPADRNLLVVKESIHFPVQDQTEVLENWMDLRVKSEEAIVSSNEELQLELSVHSVVEDISLSGDQECFISKGLSPEGSEDISFQLKSVSGIESPVSSKEAEQPSPVSVLEPPFTDDLPPGSDCFESLSADLLGLRMQLKLLKLETEAFTESEETQHISSDEDGVEGSVGSPEDKYTPNGEDSWEISYLTDVLQSSAFKDTEPDMFVAMWHSLECPVDPSTFEYLEKKYAVRSSQPRSERKLLFDCINLGILDIYQKFTDPYPWVRPPTIQVGYSEGLCNNLCKFLAKQQVKKVDEDIVEKVVGRTSQWLVLGYDVDVIGKEIERLVVDELITEVVDMYL